MIDIRRILAPFDFSDISQHAFRYAVALAERYQARITALHVFVHRPAVHPIPPLYPSAVLPADVVTIREELAREMRVLLGVVPGARVGIDVSVRDATDVHREILAQADERKADLIVIGSHGRSGFDRLVLGSVSEKVIRKATAPVLVVPLSAHDAPHSGALAFHRILCAIDFSAGARDTLTYAMSLAEETDAQLTLLHVIDALQGFDDLPTARTVNVREIRAAAESDCLQRLDALVPDSVRSSCHVDSIVTEGKPSSEILRAAAERNCDLIVMGVQGRGAIDLMLFGSTTHAVIRLATSPVLTVRGGGARQLGPPADVARKDLRLPPWPL
jgi:nucleotide-binding universal stress UspA family protein